MSSNNIDTIGPDHLAQWEAYVADMDAQQEADYKKELEALGQDMHEASATMGEAVDCELYPYKSWEELTSAAQDYWRAEAAKTIASGKYTLGKGWADELDVRP